MWRKDCKARKYAVLDPSYLAEARRSGENMVSNPRIQPKPDLQRKEDVTDENAPSITNQIKTRTPDARQIINGSQANPPNRPSA